MLSEFVDELPVSLDELEPVKRMWRSMLDKVIASGGVRAAARSAGVDVAEMVEAVGHAQAVQEKMLFAAPVTGTLPPWCFADRILDSRVRVMVERLATCVTTGDSQKVRMKSEGELATVSEVRPGGVAVLYDDGYGCFVPWMRVRMGDVKWVLVEIQI